MGYVYVNSIGGRDTGELWKRPGGLADILRDKTARRRGGRRSLRAYTNDLLRPSLGGTEVEK